MELYHASPFDGITEFNNKISLTEKVYFATRKQDCCAYLANPVQIVLKLNKPCYKWAVNDRDKTTNTPILLEWWEGAFEELYKGVSSNYYVVDKTADMTKEKGYYTYTKPVAVKKVIKVPDIYKELLRLEKSGKIILKRFKDLTKKDIEVIKGFVEKIYNGEYKSKEAAAFCEAKLSFYRDIEILEK